MNYGSVTRTVGPEPGITTHPGAKDAAGSSGEHRLSGRREARTYGLSTIIDDLGHGDYTGDAVRPID